MTIPKSILHFERHPGDDDFFVHNLLFHQLHIVHLDPLPSSITSIVNHVPYIKLDSPLNLLLDPAILNAIQEHKRHVSIISLHTHPDHSTQVEVHDGILVLSVPRDTYQTFGLNGHKKNKAGSHYIIRIPLNAKENAKQIDRARWCFTHTLSSAFILAVKGPQVFIDQISSAAHSATPPVTVTTHHLSSQTWTSSAPVTVPSISELVNCLDTPPSVKRLATDQGPVATKPPSCGKLPASSLEYVHDYVEWIGMVVHEADAHLMEAEIDPYLSMYQVPKYLYNDSAADAEKHSLHKTTWNGLMSAAFIKEILDALRPRPSVKRSRGDIFPGGLLDSLVIVFARAIPSQISGAPVSDHLWVLPPKPMSGFVSVRIVNRD